MNFVEESQRARKRIEKHVRKTPLEYSAELSAATGANVYLKLENQQLTGSFKLRGALSKILSLDETARKRGVVAASTGNHGAGVAKGMALFGVPGTIYVPETARASKVDAIRRQGAEVKVSGTTCDEAEGHARREAEKTGRTFISPYNDREVVAGQGTIGLELLEQLPDGIDDLFVSVGSGGLIAGIAGVLKASSPSLQVHGCSPEADCAMASSIKAGEIYLPETRPTLSDGTAGGVEPGSITFAFCQSLVDEFVLVEETAIRSALVWALEVPHLLLEGAAAVAIAGLLAKGRTLEGRNVVVILCGANIGLDVLRQVIDMKTTPTLG